MASLTTPTLATKRLLLRPYRSDDLAACHEYGADPDVCRYQRWGPNTEEDTRRFIETCVDGIDNPVAKGFMFAIVLRHEATLIGGCNLNVTNKAEGEGMIGYTLHPRYWNKGFTTEAGAELLRFGFAELRLHRITSWCTTDNIGSWRVMEKIGMRREGCEYEAALMHGVRFDIFRYAILAREWRARTSTTKGKPQDKMDDDRAAVDD